MKSPDEIKKGLDCCSEDGCKKCPYWEDCSMADGFSELAGDALALIQQLESKLECSQMTIDWLTATLLKCDTIIKQLEAERDELIEVIKEWSLFNTFPLPCKVCKNVKEAFCGEKCKWCREYNNFEWRGLQKEPEA